MVGSIALFPALLHFQRPCLETHLSGRWLPICSAIVSWFCSGAHPWFRSVHHGSQQRSGKTVPYPTEMMTVTFRSYDLPLLVTLILTPAEHGIHGQRQESSLVKVFVTRIVMFPLLHRHSEHVRID